MNAETIEKVPTTVTSAAVGGDRDAMARIYAAYRETVAAVVANRMPGGMRSEREDLVSEVFARMVANLHNYRHHGVDIGAWLTTIAKHLVSDFYRRPDRRSCTYGLTPFDIADPAPGPGDAAEARETAATVRAAINRLPRDQRRCLWLRYFQGCSCAEAAHRLGISVGALKARNFRATRALERILRR